jgi:uncharacterized membrane protein
MALQIWLSPFQTPFDVAGFVLFVLVFPVYHALYPWLIGRFPHRVAKARFDLYRRSWIEGLLQRRDVATAAQQTRNLTMVNSILASSTLILMGFSANLLLRSGEFVGANPIWDVQPDALAGKLFLLILVFAVAFGYCMTSLRHLGHFNLVIGADPAVIEEIEGSSVDYFSALINRSSNRHTLAVRCLYSASPVFLWIFDPLFFVLLTVFWGVKFIGYQDFVHVLGRSRPAQSE